MRSIKTKAVNRLRVAAALAATGLCSFTLADTIWLRAAGAKTAATKLADVKIDKVENGVLIFTVQSSGNQARKKLDEVAQVALDDEPALTAAEAAYAARDYKTAIDGYTKAADSNSRPWVRQRAALRLIDSGQKANDLVAAVTGYAAMAIADPDAAEAAKPAIPPDAPAATIDAAVATLKKAESTPGLKAEPAKALINFRIQLLTAEKNTAAASAALAELNKLNGMAPTPGVADSNPSGAQAGNRARAEAKLNEARVALSQKNYKQVLQTIDGASAIFTEPDQQAEALYAVAEAKAALAGDEQKALIDAAIAYMRVVANFKTVPGAPHVADALMQTAAIEEKLLKPEEALRLYNQVAVEFQGTPAAKNAAEGAARATAAIKAKG